MRESSTKEKIIEIGAEIIVKEGLRKFTAKNIASRLGITDAAIFKHFSSMDEIIMEIIDRYVSRCMASVDRAIKEGKSVQEKLELLMRAHIEVLEDTKGAVPILCFEFARAENKKFFNLLHDFVEKYKEKVSKILREGQEQGVVREDIDPNETAMFFIGLLQAKTFAYVMENKTGAIIENPDSLISQLFYGILRH